MISPWSYVANSFDGLVFFLRFRHKGMLSKLFSGLLKHPEKAKQWIQVNLRLLRFSANLLI